MFINFNLNNILTYKIFSLKILVVYNMINSLKKKMRKKK